MYRCYMQTLYLACVSLLPCMCCVGQWVSVQLDTRAAGMASAGSFIGISTELLVCSFVLLGSVGDTPAIAVKTAISLDDLRR